jgi:hypothetical protein
MLDFKNDSGSKNPERAGCSLWVRAIVVQFSVETREFSFLLNVQISSGATQAFCSMHAGVTWLVRDVYHSHISLHGVYGDNFTFPIKVPVNTSSDSRKIWRKNLKT